MTLTEKILHFEAGDMHDDDLVGFVQELIDTAITKRIRGLVS